LFVNRPFSFKHARRCQTLRRRSTNCWQHT
jgi:hypothetical protein